MLVEKREYINGTLRMMRQHHLDENAAYLLFLNNLKRGELKEVTKEKVTIVEDLTQSNYRIIETTYYGSIWMEYLIKHKYY